MERHQRQKQTGAGLRCRATCGEQKPGSHKLREREAAPRSAPTASRLHSPSASHTGLGAHQPWQALPPSVPWIAGSHMDAQQALLIQVGALAR